MKCAFGSGVDANEDFAVEIEMFDPGGRVVDDGKSRSGPASAEAPIDREAPLVIAQKPATVTRRIDDRQSTLPRHPPLRLASNAARLEPRTYRRDPARRGGDIPKRNP